MNNMREGTDYYYNEAGLVVFTSDYLLKRGTCCGSGCKNCPYHYLNVAEPLKSKLIAQRLAEKESGEER
jgi:hypothetical protein